MIAAIVLGAGLSSRMGEEKLLLPLGNKKVLERTIEGVQDAGFANIIVVTRREVEENIEVYPDVVYLLNNHPERGQASSMAIAMNWLMTHRPDCEGVLFFLGDQPLMDRHLVRRIKKTILANPESIVQPRYQGRQGHPVAFGRPWFKSLSDTQGDLGGRTLIKDNRKSVIEVEGSETCTMDMDTHAEYRVIQHYFYEHNDLRQRLVVVRGAGDLATGTIRRLVQCGYAVVALEVEAPLVIRRTVSFATAITQGETMVEGVWATGTIRRLVQCGYAVVALEVEAPLVIRRTVSFATAITQGETMVEGVCARRCDTLEAVAETLYAGEVAVCVDPQASIVTKLAPRYLVDAILAKKNLGTTMDMAPVHTPSTMVSPWVMAVAKDTVRRMTKGASTSRATTA